jgi:curved DNA-binding protein CbpA
VTVATTQERALPRLLAEHAAGGGSGILRANRGKLRRLFCLDKGWLVFVASNLLEEQFDEFLVRGGKMNASDRSELTIASKAKKKNVVTLALERRILSQSAAQRGMEELIANLLSSSLEWPDGSFAFEPGIPALEGEVTVKLSPIRLILKHVRTYPTSLDAVRTRIGRPDSRPTISAASQRILTGFEPNAVMEHLLEHCNGETPLGELVSRSPGDDNETLRTLYGFLMLGVVDEPRGDGPSVAGREKSRKEKALTGPELRAVLQRIDAPDLYGVLGVDRSASRDQIRRAYYGLARRYHPDHLRSGDLTGYLEEMEKYFTRVTEAYNTLMNFELRREYDDLLVVDKDDGSKAEEQSVVLARENYIAGRALIAKRRLTDAVRFLENAIQLDPSKSAYHLELGKLLTGNPRRRDEAERYLVQAKTLDPSSAEAYAGLGQLHAKRGQKDQAIAAFREALRWKADHVEARKGLKELGAS